MRIYEISDTATTLSVCSFDFPITLPSGAQISVEGAVPASSSPAYTEGSHDDPDSILDQVRSGAVTKANTTNVVNCIHVKLSGTASNGQEATVRWIWGGMNYEFKVQYTGA